MKFLRLLMIGDLPDLGDIFNPHKKEQEIETIHENENELELLDKDIYIYISKDDNKWISTSFLEIAPGGIGLHLLLPIEIKFDFEDINNIHIKFVKKKKGTSTVLKEVPVLLRWHEKDHISGKTKLGVHFHGEIKNEMEIIEILEMLKKQQGVIEL